jgi:phosphatidylglycerol:prolipoprotein diacylglycerol transferase
VAIAAAIFAGIVLAGVAARTSGRRVDDLLFVILGIVPGAVVGGRIGYVLLHAAFFGADSGRILDPGVGSLELTLGVVGGTVTGTLVALLLDGRPGPWLRVATFPTLLVLATGKLATVLGGTGQGMAAAGDPATSYLGPGPWGSLGPAIPSIPSQAIEAFVTAVVIVAVILLSALPPLRRPDGRLFLVGLALWSVGRAIVAGTWRDPVVVGPFRAEQAIDVAVAIGSMVIVMTLFAVHRGSADDDPLRAKEPERAISGRGTLRG